MRKEIRRVDQKPVRVEFGCLASPLKNQLPKDMHHRAKDLQKLADAVTLLSVRGILTTAETLRADRRLITAIECEVRGGKKA